MISAGERWRPRVGVGMWGVDVLVRQFFSRVLRVAGVDGMVMVSDMISLSWAGTVGSATRQMPGSSAKRGRRLTTCYGTVQFSSAKKKDERTSILRPDIAVPPFSFRVTGFRGQPRSRSWVALVLGCCWRSARPTSPPLKGGEGWSAAAWSGEKRTRPEDTQNRSCFWPRRGGRWQCGSLTPGRHLQCLSLGP